MIDGKIRSLRMIRSLASPIEINALPDGYRLCAFRPGEELLWGELLGLSGELGPWDTERIFKAFDPVQKKGIGRVWKESIHLIRYQDERLPVATACSQLHEAHPDLPELSWVKVAPRHRGRGLGKAVCLAVLDLLQRHGYRRCFLRTNTSRLAAVNLFFALGFEPYVDDPKHDAALWESVMRRISRRHAPIEEPPSV